MGHSYFNRDKSWLTFNERLLMEASRKNVPLMERVNFLSIFSSNLDEFYRVRMPALLALHRIRPEQDSLVNELNILIDNLQERFGDLVAREIIPALKKEGILFIYRRSVPASLKPALFQYFINHVASFLRVTELDDETSFFPENNLLYFLVFAKGKHETEKTFVVNVPSDHVPRFYPIDHRKKRYIIFLDDIIRLHLSFLVPDHNVVSCHAIKVTRTGELDIDDEFEGNLAEKIEKVLQKRDMGFATRFLYEGNIPKDRLRSVRKRLGIKKLNLVKGGRYHNLKDLHLLPVTSSKLFYKPWPRTVRNTSHDSLFDAIRQEDFILHTPYHTFDTLLRFFNEASIDPRVTSISTSVYRIAKDSRIAHALINAARNGKKVHVFVELKARFDEENNLKWARKMEQAGVRITYSFPALKVHCKIALVKRKRDGGTDLFGILGTGNFHEKNAALYTDHYLFTHDQEMLEEVDTLFRFLRERNKSAASNMPFFRKLLVGQSNLQETFLQLIENEIQNKKKALDASIVIKVNNIEDSILINKLYEACSFGVNIDLIVRGICCLVPCTSEAGGSITVRRIVDRYLEHGRVFIFGNAGDPVVFLGSADWMNRNMYRRIEVCFPIRHEGHRQEIIKLIDIQRRDSAQAVMIGPDGTNTPIRSTGPKIQSQREIALLLSRASQPVNPVAG